MLSVPFGAVDSIVSAPVPAVHVIEGLGNQAGPIKGGVEGAEIGFLLAHDSDLPKLPLPFPPCILSHSEEIPAGYLRPQVRECTCLVHVGQSDLDEELVAGGERVEGEESSHGRWCFRDFPIDSVGTPDVVEHTSRIRRCHVE